MLMFVSGFISFNQFQLSPFKRLIWSLIKPFKAQAAQLTKQTGDGKPVLSLVRKYFYELANFVFTSQQETQHSV